jgi:hypothetical protein
LHVTKELDGALNGFRLLRDETTAKPGFYVTSFTEEPHNHEIGEPLDVFRNSMDILNVEPSLRSISDADTEAMWIQGRIYYDACMPQNVAYEKLLETHFSAMRALQLTAEKLYSKLRHLSRCDQAHPGMDAFDFITLLQGRSLNEPGFTYNFCTEE